MKAGPDHRAGHLFVEIVNAAANLWKHRAEWSDDDPSRAQVLTSELVGALGVELKEDYVSMSVLAEIVRPLPLRFATIVPFLDHWSESLARSPE